ncbi:MAG TPA: hypothetical protein VFK37_06705 [Bacillales bacterium]|nr:hypothetical protein [Bacillales bacterium]HEU5140790.1 hypothetical protein [Bacillales bacterium]
MGNRNFERARQFMKTKARRLEKAIFEYEFESAAYARVLEELVQFQNEDGGFGHGLEPDLRCPESSAVATTRALEILQLDQGRDEQDPIIKKALQYLEETFREERLGWDIIPKAAENSPRAIWWDYGVFEDNWGNPNADIVSYFIEYRSLYSLDKLDDLINYAIEYLVESCDLEEMHELFCYLRLYERLGEEQKQKIKGTLDKFVDNCVVKNPGDRQGYGATPLKVVDSPDSLYYPKYSDVMPRELDGLIDQQTEEGSWEPDWTWHQFEDEWQNAKEEWKGILTLDALRTLRNFERLGH